MKTHNDIDRRSLILAREIVDRIDRDTERKGLAKARSVCERWAQNSPQPAVDEWRSLLKKDWHEIRKMLLADDETGQRLRQSSPFCGILTPVERWRIYRKGGSHDPGAT